MAPIRSLLQQITRRNESGDQGADLVLGLPLEVEDRTIYPVFLDPRSNEQNGAEPRQAGYLELRGDRSDFISLEPASRSWAVVPVILLLLVIGVLVARRVLGNRSGNQ